MFWEEFVDPAEADDVRNLVQAIAAGAPSREHDNTWMTSAGERVSIAWTCTPLPEIDERKLFSSPALDITERKRIAEELRASRARLVRAEEQARRALERNLHDGAQQRLVALSVALRLVESKIEPTPAAPRRSSTARARSSTQHSQSSASSPAGSTPPSSPIAACGRRSRRWQRERRSRSS